MRVVLIDDKVEGDAADSKISYGSLVTNKVERIFVDNESILDGSKPKRQIIEEIFSALLLPLLAWFEQSLEVLWVVVFSSIN